MITSPKSCADPAESVHQTAIDVHSGHVPSSSSEVPGVERALDLLELLVFSARGLTLSEVSRKLGMAKSSSHRLIRVLEKRGYLQRKPDGHHYILGRRVGDLTSVTTADQQLQATCFLHAQKIAKKLQLTVLVAVPTGAEGVIILKVESPNDIFPGAFVGHHFDLHCTALGKALVAYLPEAEIHRIFHKQNLIQYTASTICNFHNLMADLAQVRVRGFSINNEELTLGGRSVAAPIFSHIGRAIASICVRGSTKSFSYSRILSCGKEVVSVANEISRDLLEAMPQEVQLGTNLEGL
jgi:DNA-binding IclR family transcriptional regulator